MKHNILEDFEPLVLPLLKLTRPGHAGIVDPSVNLSILDFIEKSIKREWAKQ